MPREPDADDALRPLDRRRIREIKQWLEGNRPEGPTREELRDFLAWVAGEIEWHLARRQSVDEFVALLNAARAAERERDEEE